MTIDYSLVEQQINDILYGKRNFPQITQQEHAGVCSAGAGLVGAIIVCDTARASLETSASASASKTAPTNWEIDEEQEFNYISNRLRLEDMHPANVYIEPNASIPLCIDCIVKFVKTH